MTEAPNVSLEERVAMLQKELDAERARAAAKQDSGFKAWLRRVGRGIAAAFTTNEAVKAEKSLAAMIVVRLLLFLGASEGAVKAVEALLKAVGVTQ